MVKQFSDMECAKMFNVETERTTDDNLGTPLKKGLWRIVKRNFPKKKDTPLPRVNPDHAPKMAGMPGSKERVEAYRKWYSANPEGPSPFPRNEE